MTITIDQLIDDLGLTYSRDADGSPNTLRPPNPVPPVGTLYVIVQETGDSRTVQLQGGPQDRTLLVLVSVYGAPDTAAGRWQVKVVLAHLKARAKEVTAHAGIRLRECLPTDGQPVTRDSATNTAYGSVRFALSYTSP